MQDKIVYSRGIPYVNDQIVFDLLLDTDVPIAEKLWQFCEDANRQAIYAPKMATLVVVKPNQGGPFIFVDPEYRNTGKATRLLVGYALQVNLGKLPHPGYNWKGPLGEKFEKIFTELIKDT